MQETKDKLCDIVDEVDYQLEGTNQEMPDYIELEKIKLGALQQVKEIDEAAELNEKDKRDAIIKGGFDIAKVVLPVILSGICYSVFQKRLLKFEETGVVKSHASKDLHLPKIF